MVFDRSSIANDSISVHHASPVSGPFRRSKLARSVSPEPWTSPRGLACFGLYCDRSSINIKTQFSLFSLQHSTFILKLVDSHPPSALIVRFSLLRLYASFVWRSSFADDLALRAELTTDSFLACGIFSVLQRSSRLHSLRKGSPGSYEKSKYSITHQQLSEAKVTQEQEQAQLPPWS